MNYFIVYQVNGKSYLLVNSLSQTNTRLVLEVFDSIKAVRNFYQPFTDAINKNREMRIRATLAMMTTNPVACLVDNLDELSDFIYSSEIHELRGGELLKTFKGVPVKEDILKYLDFNVWKDCLNLAGERE